MKTLYVSDLDGTLLDEHARITPVTARILTRLIEEKGLLFTVATARSPATAVKLLQDIPLRLPLVVMTGALLYDPVDQTYPLVQALSPHTVKTLTQILDRYGISAFVHTVQNGMIDVFYRQLTTDFERLFVSRRTGTGFKRFFQTSDYMSAIRGGQVTLFTVMNKKEVVDLLRPEFEAVPGTTCYCYREEYGSDNYYLEVFSQQTSKASALQKLMEMTGAEALCSFGDNVNDIPMFRISTESYATQNAAEAAKAAACGVIGPNTGDGVARFLEKRFLQS
ncbi:MAG: HAD hydrolase family protein [Oscillospiraceae bacterium]|nr:HAD hydrolase family protein [Oscillospiraceae bacterium]